MIEGERLHIVIQGCIKGQPSMQKEFYYTYYSTLMKVAVRYARSKEDAEQWVHDGFLKIFSNLDSFRNQGSFEGWIRKIMTRTCIDQLRAHNALRFEVDNNTVYSNYEIPSHEGLIANDIVQKFSADDMLHLLRVLPEKQKIVFNLHVFEEYNHKEIAGMLGITENHSYWLLHQARKNMKEQCSSLYKKKTKV